ncbi:MAG: pyridoxamine 5'-phosphate oxidase family protein [Actinobacteria bacterium]|nr:pyridoxamine 5'-phosphate oxidase family protein [Actinomycetota bacterium]
MSTVVPSSDRDLLDAKGFALIATIGPAAAPQVSPTWYLWDAAAQQLLVSLTTSQKYRNLQRDSHVAVCIPEPANPYRHLELRGRVSSIEVDDNRRLTNTSGRSRPGLAARPWIPLRAPGLGSGLPFA